MKATHLDAEQRYSQVRLNTIKAAQHKLNKIAEYKSIELKCIDSKALKVAKWWDNYENRQVDRDGVEGYSEYEVREPKEVRRRYK